MELVLLLIPLLLWSCSPAAPTSAGASQPVQRRELPADAPARDKIIASALEQTTYTLSYDPAYVTLRYPGGDVPRDRGVCSDVIIRAFRSAGVDLQKDVHEDMRQSFARYPRLWGLARPDPNIDHRRVANLMTFFKRKGKSLPVASTADAYVPGDLVAWKLDGGQLHIGLVTDQKTGSGRNLIVHNIGAGARLEDVLFSWQVIGHYRYFN
jgi:uncharacterized protein YijF (DUF1287 family)